MQDSKLDRPFDVGDVSEKTDFTYLLNRQIDRVAQLGTLNQVAGFINAVELLESMLEAYKDSSYDTAIEAKENKIKTYYSHYPANKRAAIASNLEYNFALIKFKELVKLMSRKALIPTRKITAQDEG